MTETTARGKFLWHTLLTADAQAAAEFYGEVIGWQRQSAPADPGYLLLTTPNGMLAGVLQFPDDASAAPASHWLPYIGAPDIRDTIAQCQALGGSVHKEVTVVPNAGEFAVLADPQGAEFAVYTPSGAADPTDHDAEISEFSWHELATTDLAAAVDFYRQLFSWEEIAAHDMGPMGTYLIFGRNGQQLGGMFKVMGDDPAAPSWLSYVRVADVDETVAQVKAAGGQVINGPMEVPGGDWIAQCLDPQGAAFAVHALQKIAQAKPLAQADAEPPDTEDQEFAATLVMERDSSLLPLASTKTKRKAKAAARPPVKSTKSVKAVKAVAKKAKKTAAKGKRVAPAAAKRKTTAKKAGKPAAAAVKKTSKRVGKQVKAPRRKPTNRPPAKAKQAAKRKK